MYEILKILLILSTFACGKMLAKHKIILGRNKYHYSFGLSTLLVVIIYTLTEGLRYGRGTDYFGYYNYFLKGANGTAPIFDLFSNFHAFANFPFYFGFLFSSFLLIYLGLKLIYHYRFAAFFILPLFYLETIVQSSNLLRMFVSFSFVFMSLSYIIKKNNLMFILFFLVAFLIHYSCLILLPFILILNLYKNPIPNRLTIIILFLFFNFFFIIELDIINSLFNRLSILNIYSNYITSTDRWLYGEGVLIDEVQKSLYYNIRLYFVPIFTLWYGYPFLEKYKTLKFNIFYYLYFIGLLALPLALSLPTEIIYRLVLFFITFKFIVLGVVLNDFTKNFKTYSIFSRLFFIYIILDIAYTIFKSIFQYSELGKKFVWDII